MLPEQLIHATSKQYYRKSLVHFTLIRYLQDCKMYCYINRNSLNWNAVPTVFDVPNPPPSTTVKRPLPTYRNAAAQPPAKKRLLPDDNGMDLTATA